MWDKALEHMKSLLARGASVTLPDGRVVTDVDQLPGVAHLPDWHAEHAERMARARAAGGAGPPPPGEEAK